MTETITEIKGHSYKTETFPLRELVGLELELGKIMGGAAGPGIDYLWGLFSVDKDGVHLAPDPDKAADSTKLGSAIAALPAGIIEAGGYDFIARILSRTSREVDLRGDATGLSFAKLSDPHPGADGSTWMDNIYPGHLGEMHLAILWVLMVNFSPFGRVPSWSLNALWGELSERIPTLPKAAMEAISNAGSEEPQTPNG